VEALLGIDIGTTGTKSILFKVDGKVIFRDYIEYGVTTPKPGWYEQDPETWWSAVVRSVRVAIKKTEISPNDVLGIGLSGQTNGIVCVDPEGKPLRPCIIWMDRRAVEEESIKGEITAQELHKTTGVLIDPFFSICKIMWMKNNESDIFEKTETILQPKDYLILKLTGRRILDVALASCTGLLDTRRKKYAVSILSKLGLPIEKLPELTNPTSIIGELSKSAARELGLPEGIPVVAGTGDVMANAIGSGVVEVGQAYTKTATVSDVVLSTAKPVFDEKLRFATYIHPTLNKWLLMGGATGGGLCYRWFRDTFGQLERSLSKDLGKDAYNIMNEEAKLAEPACKGLIFLPYLAGVRSPIWDTKARGAYFGISLEHEKRHFIRAILEGVAYSMRHRIEIMENSLRVPVKEIRVVGGGGRSPLWRQIMADVCNKPILFPSGEDHECLGAAILASVGAGIYPNAYDATDQMVSIIDRNEPNEEIHKRYGKYYRIYVGLYNRLKGSFHQLSKS
jgi:xylulokinase